MKPYFPTGGTEALFTLPRKKEIEDKALRPHGNTLENVLAETEKTWPEMKQSNLIISDMIILSSNFIQYKPMTQQLLT